MILYHGTNQTIDIIDLSVCKPNKDFGQGFYLTDIEQQAQLMAKRRTRIIGNGTPTVIAFEFDERFLYNSNLNVKIFETPSKEWALFILKNRNEPQVQSSPFVIGPIADDGVTFQLERYTNHLISLEMLVEELTYRKLNHQYFFGTEKSISYLKKL